MVTGTTSCARGEMGNFISISVLSRVRRRSLARAESRLSCPINVSDSF